MHKTACCLGFFLLYRKWREAPLLPVLCQKAKKDKTQVLIIVRGEIQLSTSLVGTSERKD